MITLWFYSTTGNHQTHKAYVTHARSVSDLIQSQYWIPGQNLYREFITDTGKPSKDPAFAWDMAVLLSAWAAASKFDQAKFQPIFDQAETSLSQYGSTSAGIFGYAVLPHQSDPDRYYDDNEWIALAQLDAYDATHSRKYLDEAVKTFEFVMSGASSDLGGGLFWREKEKKSKNTCSNAPAILVASRLFMATKDAHYLSISKELHVWVERLKDKNNLMADNMTLAGKIEGTEWTYNAALMIRSDVALYQATSDKSFLSEAIDMAIASQKKWVDPETGAIRDEAAFAHHLSEAFIALAPYDNSKPWKAVGLKATEQAYRTRGSDGFFGSRWDQFKATDRRILLFQASIARALWLASSIQ